MPTPAPHKKDTMTTTTTNPAENYSRSIAEELIALDTLLDWQSDDDDRAQAFQTLEMDPDTDPADAINIYLNETALDLAIRRDTRGSEYPATIEILRTCGGPHCDIIRDTNDGIAIEVTTYDTPHRYTHRIYLSALSDHLDQIADEYA